MLKIAPEPTFIATVRIHVPGGADVPVNVTFRHKGKTALRDFMERAKSMDDIDSVCEIVSGWDGVSDVFSRESLAEMLDAYPPAAVAIIEGYLAEIGKAAAKN